GEHYLCHPFFKKLHQHKSIFIFFATDSALQVEQLPLCLVDATFISMNSDLLRLKNQIAKRLTVSTTSSCGGLEKDSRR
ncbi:helix-turn-helix transcriptional regulator, partial [Klebsiella pneumoniae]|nr:helix-turn-helix transcriptional regulator [Klebsiella pneumoniae]